MRLDLEALESRVVLSAQHLPIDSLVLPAIYPPPPGYPHCNPSPPPAEMEPNDTLEQANEINLSGEDAYPWFKPANFLEEPCFWIMADGVAQPRLARPIRADYLHGTISGELPVSIATEDVDYFRFQTDGERKIDLYADGGAIRNGAVIELLDEKGNLLAAAETPDWDGDGVPDNAHLEYYTRSGGMFFLRVSGAASPENAEENTYTLNVNVFSDPYNEHEPNDVLTEANPILMTELYGGWEYGRRFGIDVTFGGRPQPWIQPPSGETGSISGAVGSKDGAPDVDFFQVRIEPNRQVRIEITGGLAWHGGGALAFLDADGQELASDLDASDGLAVEGAAGPDGGIFFIRVSQSPHDADDQNGEGDPTVGIDGGGMNRWAGEGHYSVNVTATAPRDPVQGPDETEPNDSPDTANVIDLRIFPTFAPGLELRGGYAHGITAMGDQDYFQFKARAGEHVSVAVSSLFAHGEQVFESFMDLLGDRPLPRGLLGGLGRVKDPLGFLEKHFPDVLAAPVQLVVYDADGNEIGRTTTRLDDAKGVSFDAPADGVYYAAVTVGEDAGGEPVHYRLGVLAQLQQQADETPPPGDDGDFEDEPGGQAEVDLRSGESFEFVDADGDVVTIRFKGRGGSATILFTGPEADGSDIEEIIVHGGRRGGALDVLTDGDAEVGTIEVYGFRRRGRVVGAFNRVSVDGNLGDLFADVNLKKVDVDGFLGDIEAPEVKIGRLEAEIFDRALAEVGSIRTLKVDKNMAEAVLEHFMPWRPETGFNVPPNDLFQARGIKGGGEDGAGELLAGAGLALGPLA